MSIKQLLEHNRVIASVKDQASLARALKSDCKVIFVLFGNICNISRIVQQIKTANKFAFIHVDLLDGTTNSDVVVEFLKLVTQADGIISTKTQMIKAAQTHGFYTILRLFIVDSISYHNIYKQVGNCHPDCIEVMPGVMPTVIRWILERLNIPIISGGLICDEETAHIALNAGTNAISTTNEDVWKLYGKV